MAIRADIVVADTPTTGVQFAGGGSQGLVLTPTGVLYYVYIETTGSVVFKKSSDGGMTWTDPTLVKASNTTNLSIWYDRWSGISAGLIHCAYTESSGSDTLYRSIDTESSDTLGTQTTIFAGTSRANGGGLSVCRSRGGNVYCWTMIDAGAEGGFFRLPNANVPSGAWDAARTINEALATTDQMLLCPGFAADNQDMIAIFWDASANEISRQVYDDSANSWAETSIATSMNDQVATTAYPHFAVSIDLTNSRILMAAWSNVDTLNADLRFWTVTESAITESAANVVLNSTDDQGLCAVGLDTGTGYWYVFYGGKSDGSETYTSVINIYYKVSKDSGATWGPETLITNISRDWRWLVCTPRFSGPQNWGIGMMKNQNVFQQYYSACFLRPRVSSQIL